MGGLGLAPRGLLPQSPLPVGRKRRFRLRASTLFLLRSTALVRLGSETHLLLGATALLRNLLLLLSPLRSFLLPTLSGLLLTLLLLTLLTLLLCELFPALLLLPPTLLCLPPSLLLARRLLYGLGAEATAAGLSLGDTAVESLGSRDKPTTSGTEPIV